MEKEINMKNKEFFYKVSVYCWLGVFLIIIYLTLTSCATQRRYPTYSSKKCHWDIGTHEAQMREKDNR